MNRPRQPLIIASLLFLAVPACGHRSQPSAAGGGDATETSQPESSEMTEQGAIEHMRSLAKSGVLKTTVALPQKWDFDAKEYKPGGTKQVNVPENVDWHASKNENGMWRVEGDF